MKNIVLYKIVLMAGMLMTITILNGQKPTISLLPSSHHYMHPEAMIDTSITSDSLAQFFPCPLPQFNEDDILKADPVKKVRRQIGPSFDSIFNKEEARRISGGNGSNSFPLYMKYLNPIKLFIHITALK
jgi:hypothetical protein